MNWGNVSLIGGIVTAILAALIALYRARPQRDLDDAQRKKIDEEVKRLQAAHDRRRTLRMLRLEKYLDADVEYHRKMRVFHSDMKDLVTAACKAGYLPLDHELPEPPEPPELPEMPDVDDE